MIRPEPPAKMTVQPPQGHYSVRLAAGDGRMTPVFFDPTVLQRYVSDPRYYFRYDDFGGMLGTADEFYLSDDFPSEDKVLVDTFGLGWADGRPQAIAVYLVYLAKLSPRHQGLWHAFELAEQDGHELDRDYVKTSVYGEWPDQPSAVEAIFEEQRVLNDIADAIGRPPMFKQLFDAGDRPRGLQPFLLPTHEEMGRFILHLDQVLSENLNPDFFAGEVQRFEEQTLRDGRVLRNTKGTIRLLNEWIEQRYRAKPQLAATVTAPLAEVRELRQRPAHRLLANDFDAAAWSERARLLGAVHAGLRALRQELQQEAASRLPSSSVVAAGERMRPWAAWDIDSGQLDWSIKQRSGIATWWGPDHDAAIVRNAVDWRWMWDLKTSSEITEHPAPDIAAWKEAVPESESRRWYGLVLEWVRIRGIELDVRRLIKEPLVKKCLLCGLRMREDSLPYSLIERLGAWDLNFCRPCLERTLWDSFGSNRLGRLQIAAWIRRLVEAVQRIPDQAFPSRVGDLTGMDARARTRLLAILTEQPTRARVRRVFGSWFAALKGSGVLEEDAQRMSRGTRCLALDSHLCHSFGEKTIDDLLFRAGVAHDREPPYPGYGFRGDFAFSGIIVEYLGLTGDPSYDAKQALKRRAARAAGLTVVEVTPRDLRNEKSLRAKLGMRPA